MKNARAYAWATASLWLIASQELKSGMTNQQFTGDAKQKHLNHFCKSFVFNTGNFQLLIRIHNIIL